MEKLAICSKILYDNDMLYKQNELDKYKKDMLEPMIYFNSQEAFYEKKARLLHDLEEKIIFWHKEHFLDHDQPHINRNRLEEALLINIQDEFQSTLYATIFEVLKEFFGDTNWLSTLVYHICVSLAAICTSINRHYSFIENVIQNDNICSILYSSIQDILNEMVFDFHQNKFFRFKCHACSKHTGWVWIDNNNICVECGNM
jgi:hypothetical protein|tara:strand:- start:1388 stop:1990 length:603 start_codon:yes stop_codon:yes gene_type:complete